MSESRAATAARWAQCRRWAEDVCPLPPEDRHGQRGLDHGVSLAAMVAYCSPPGTGEITRDHLDPVLLALVTAAADVPARISWIEREQRQRAPLDALRAELARRLRAAGHDLDQHGPDAAVASWRALHTTPWSPDATSPWNKEPYCSIMFESWWDEPGQTPLGHGVLWLHEWLNRPAVRA